MIDGDCGEDESFEMKFWFNTFSKVEHEKRINKKSHN